MRILLAPAKTMRQGDALPVKDLPALLPRTREILAVLQSMPLEALQALWGCNDALAQQNWERLQQLDPETDLTPALLAYDGIVFQHIAPETLTPPQLDYLQQNLRILSGFYGVLRPLDGIRAYRLEMQAKLPVGQAKNLYAFWGDSLYQQVRDPDGVLVNLASKEFSKCIEKYLQPTDRMVTCQFCETVKDKLVQRGTFAKMARGEMVRYLAENQITRPEEMQAFDKLGFFFRPDVSTDTEYIFERIP